MNIVIGSGPAGVSCARALLDRGAEVTLIDAGVQIEPERAAALTLLQGMDPQQWTGAAVRFLKEGMQASGKGVLLKRAYGSDYPYRVPFPELGLSLQDAEILPSFAQGGLSAVWGGAVLPYREEDIADWPISLGELAPHYRAVAKFMPIATGEDHLADLLPLYTDSPQRFEHSEQAQRLLSRWREQSVSLNAAGIRYGSSRVAVQMRPRSGDGCAYCSLCMYGCPRQLIYNSSQTLTELMSSDRFRYVPGIAVERIRELAETVTVSARDIQTRENVGFSGRRVFVASGVLNTARLGLASGWTEAGELELQDSQYFLLPLFMKARPSDGYDRNLHTLSQLFLELVDREVSPYTVHLQVYTYSDLFHSAMRATAGPLAGMMGPMADFMLRRIVMVQGYLHSSHSHRLAVGLKGDEQRTLCVSRIENHLTAKILRRVLKKLRANHGPLGAFPLSPLLRCGLPGRGFHTGSSFPMKDRVVPGTTDVWGRPHGMNRTHVVDASVLPSIAATTITFTVMANAHRIGDACAEI